MIDLTDKEVEEIYKERIDSESAHLLTENQKKISDERIEKANEYAKKLREHQGLNY